MAGVLAGALVLGVAHLVAALTVPAASPVLAVGATAVDLTPGWLEDLAIAWFGTRDKLALGVGMAVVLTAVTALTGILAGRRRAAGAAAVIGLGAVAGAAALTRPGATPLWAVPVVSGTTLGLLALLLMIDAVSKTSRPVPGGASRRAVRPDRVPDVERGLLPDRHRPQRAPGRHRHLAARSRPRRATGRVPPGRPPRRRPGRALGDPDLRLQRGRRVPGRQRPLARRPGPAPARTGPAHGRRRHGPVPQRRRLDGVHPALRVHRRTRRARRGRHERQPLPYEHGFPARLVVPGLYGYVSATKWLIELELTRFDLDTAYWTDRGWAAQAPIRTASRIDVPRSFARIAAGPTAVAGVAWAQHRGLQQVEVRVDRGPWQPARLADGAGIDTWAQWVWTWDAEPGDHTLEVRATDRTGAAQPQERRPPQARRIAALAAVAGLALVTTGCAGSDDDATASPPLTVAPSSATVAASPTVDAMSGPVGPGCAAYAAAVPDGAGSVDGMAKDPVAVAASNNPLLKTLVAAVSGQLNPDVNLVDTLNGGQFTVFAPVDDAFGKIDAATIETLKTDDALLTKILTYHVVPGQLAPDAVVGMQKTVQGGSVTVAGRPRT